MSDSQNAKAVLDMIRAKWDTMKASGPVSFTWNSNQKDTLYQHVQRLCQDVKSLLRSDKYPLFELSSPVCVLGDLHGNYEDVLFYSEV